MKSITVFGSFNYDMAARLDRFPAPGETILGRKLEGGPGGKGSNQAIAAKRAGAEIAFITKIGDDQFGREALNTFRDAGIDLSGVIVDKNMPTGSAFILIDDRSGQNMIVVNKGASSYITLDDIKGVEHILEKTDLLLVQLETNMDAVEEVIFKVKSIGGTVILNPAPAMELDTELYKAIDIISPNETEAELLTGVRVDSFETAERAAAVLMKKGVSKVVITLGERGAYVNDGVHSEVVPSYHVKAVDTTGAGDTFNGALCAALAEGRTLFQAVHFANAAAAISVTRQGAGTASPVRKEIDELLWMLPGNGINRKKL